MRILVVHNAYRHHGGEDVVVEAESALLEAQGHVVERYIRTNDEIECRAHVAAALVNSWSTRTSREISALIQRIRPDLIHAHNTTPLISPSLYWAAAKLRVPVVQTLHNFRLLCVNALLLRSGTVCEECVGKVPWRGVMRACYRKSRSASFAVAGSVTLHRALGTYRRKVARYIALNEFCRRKFIEAGFHPELISVKPNFVQWPSHVGASVPNHASMRSGFLFVGRLSGEKGMATLVRAKELLGDLPLTVVGAGPESPLVERCGATLLGQLTRLGVHEQMSRATALVVPSVCYETFGMTVIEAFSCRTPVIASRIGALAELVEDGVTGLLFEPGNPEDLADKISWARAHPEAMLTMGQAAFSRYQAEFTPQANYDRLMSIYAVALQAPLGPERLG